MINSYVIFEEVLEIKSIKDLSEELYVHTGTIKRWILNKKVPNNYLEDLNRILNYKYNFDSDYRNKCQFYTTKKTSLYCYNKTLEVLKEIDINYENYYFIEPSAGCCSFYEILPKNRRIGIDLEPKGKLKNEIIKINYLDFFPKIKNKYIVIGNPPFGLRGNLALRFINHSYSFADVVAFILPPLFNSSGKGVPMKRVKGYKLAYTEKLPLNSFEYPNGKEVNVATIFQIWVKVNTDKIINKQLKECKSIMKIFSLSDGGTPSSTRNKNMIGKCDVYLPSTCFSGMRAYTKFDDLPNKRGYGIIFYKYKKNLMNLFFNKINWDDVAFLSTNSAKNLRLDIIEDEIISRGYYDK